MSKSNQTLRGLNVLVTRPDNQGDALVQAIQHLGGRAHSLPLMNIRPLANPVADKLIKHLDQFQLAIFISANAVAMSLSRIRQHWPSLPEGLRILAVGPATAVALEPLGCEVIAPQAGMRSEELLALPILARVQGLRIALFRGRGGRELLADTLRARGATVDYIELYERTPPDVTTQELASMLHQLEINAITLTSGQILETLRKLLGDNTSSLDQVTLLVPSGRVQQMALAAGLPHVVNVNGADDQSLLAGLAMVARRRAG